MFCFGIHFSFSQSNNQKRNNLTGSGIKDGVYFTFKDIKNNQPSLLIENLFKSLYDSSFTYSQWANSTNLYYIDKTGNRMTLNRDSIWGYAENGIPYICIGQRFHKINTVGAISVFTEFYPLIRDPLSLVVTNVKGTTADRILDFENGRVGEYSLENFSSILQHDEELYNEFQKIKKEKARRKKVYAYIEKYNLRHPLFESSTKIKNNP